MADFPDLNSVDEPMFRNGSGDGNHAYPSEDAAQGSAHSVGARFRGSESVHFFSVPTASVPVDTWVVVSTSRGQQPACIVVAPHQVSIAQFEDDLTPIERVLTKDDVERMKYFRHESSRVVTRGNEISRESNMDVKIVSADYSLDGAHVRASYTAQHEDNIDGLDEVLADEFDTRVEMFHLAVREETRLIGGLGKRGCMLDSPPSLTTYPDPSVEIAWGQDVPLKTGKMMALDESLLSRLSHEDATYRQAKHGFPRLGQRVMTAQGVGIVASVQVFKKLVTVRYDDSNREEIYPVVDVFADDGWDPQVDNR